MDIFEEMIHELDTKYIFRFRPYTATTSKELLYNEMYFYSKNEVNDPYDLSVELRIPAGNPGVFKYFIEAAFQKIRVKENHIIQPSDVSLAILAARMLADADRRLSWLISDECESLFVRCFVEARKSDVNFDFFWKSFKYTLENLRSDDLRGISFSRNYKNMALWSVYANRHQGICEVFEPKNETLELRRWNQSDFETFRIYPVEYNKEKEIDVSLMFDENGKIDNKKVFDAYFPELVRKSYLTKSSEWAGEEEFRIFQNVSISFSSSKKEEKPETLGDKLYYFSDEQFVGVILGSHMPQRSKDEVTEILESKSGTRKVFQASPNGNQVDVLPVKIFSK